MLQTCDPEIVEVAKYDCKLVFSEIGECKFRRFVDVANLCSGDRGCCKLVISEISEIGGRKFRKLVFSEIGKRKIRRQTCVFGDRGCCKLAIRRSRMLQNMIANL